MPHPQQSPLHFNWANVNLLLRKKISTRSNKIKTKKPPKSLLSYKTQSPRVSQKRSHLSKAVWRNLKGGARRGSIALADRSPCFPSSTAASTGSQKPWNTSRQPESFPRKRVYPKKPQWLCRKGTLREFGQEPKGSRALCEHSLWWGLHHSAPSPAPPSPSMEQGWVSSTQGCGIHAGSSPKRTPLAAGWFPCPASLLPSRLSPSFLPSNTDSDRLSVAISMNRQQSIMWMLSQDTCDSLDCKKIN